jgi:MinD-like ATPase involved in chromosome partitioning or flagellar assembly
MSKAEEKAEGRESPDRADSLVLAFSDLTIQAIADEIKKSVKTSKRVYLGKTQEEIEDNYDKLEAKLAASETHRKKIYGSLNSLLKNNSSKDKQTKVGNYSFTDII